MNEQRLSAEEASRFLGNCLTDEYRAKCIAFWRELHGNDYMDSVIRFESAKGKKKKK